MKKTFCRTAMLVTLVGSLALLGSGCSKKAVIPPDSSGTGSQSGGGAGTSGYDENSLAAEGTLDDAATTGSSGMDSASDEYKRMHGRCSEGLSPVYFDFDQSAIRSDMTEVLVRNAEFMQKSPGGAIVIEGNTDERGTSEYNLALGERRALAAKQYLLDLGVDGARIQTISYGEERPLFTGQDEDSYSQNRRDDFIMK
jgi:peptidoglycan-associated lipoprotein